MVTLKEIAKVSGFSVSTVSAVLSDRAVTLGIKAETSRKIRDIAEKRGYRHNAIASQMQSGRATAIACILPYSNVINPDILLGASLAADSHRHFVKLISIDQTGDDYVKTIERMLEHRPAGILHWSDAGPTTDYLLAVSKECRIPIVFIDYFSEKALYSVGDDSVSGTDQVIRHLHGLGHRRIAHITDILAAHWAEIRYGAFRDSMKKLSLPIDEAHIFHDRLSPTSTLLKDFVLRMMALSNRPTAIYCGSDFIALEVMTTLLQADFRIPEDVSLVGYGNVRFSEFSFPRLTTVRQPQKAMGETAVNMLMEILNGQAEPRKAHLPTEIIVRGSSGECPISNKT